MKVADLREKTKRLMPGVRADLERLVRIPSVAFDGFPAESVTECGAAAAYGKEVVHYGEGGSIPLAAAFHKALPDAELILWGPEEPLCKIHAPNESVDLAEIERCVLAEALFISWMADTK